MKIISKMFGAALAAKYEGPMVEPFPDRMVALLTRLDLMPPASLVAENPASKPVSQQTK